MMYSKEFGRRRLQLVSSRAEPRNISLRVAVSSFAFRTRYHQTRYSYANLPSFNCIL